jgi:hypothetical protein
MIYRLPEARCCTETIHAILLYQPITSFNIFQVTSSHHSKLNESTPYRQNTVLKTKSSYHTVSTADKFSQRLPSKSTLVAPKMRWQPIKKSFNHTMRYMQQVSEYQRYQKKLPNLLSRQQTFMVTGH